MDIPVKLSFWISIDSKEIKSAHEALKILREKGGENKNPLLDALIESLDGPVSYIKMRPGMIEEAQNATKERREQILDEIKKLGENKKGTIP